MSKETETSLEGVTTVVLAHDLLLLLEELPIKGLSYPQKLAMFRLAAAFSAARENAEESAAETTTTYTLHFNDKIMAIKLVRHLLGLGLKEAKDIVDSGEPLTLTANQYAQYKTMYAIAYGGAVSLQEIK